jgi:hypothetical protein
VFYATTLSNYSIVESISFGGMIITGKNRPGVDVFTTHSTGIGVWLNTASFCNKCPEVWCELRRGC